MDKRCMDSPHLDLIRYDKNQHFCLLYTMWRLYVSLFSCIVCHSNGRLLRAKDFGLTPTMNSSLEVNQSFPRLSRKLKSATKVQLSKQLLNPDAVTGGMDSISFSTQATNTSFYRNELTSHFEDSILAEEDAALNPNPNKGVLTIDIVSSQVHSWLDNH